MITNIKPQLCSYFTHEFPKQVILVGAGITTALACNRLDRWIHPVKYAIKGASPRIDLFSVTAGIALFLCVDRIAKVYFDKAHNGQQSPPAHKLGRLVFSSAIASSLVEVSLRLPFSLSMPIIGASIIAKTLLLSLAERHDQVTYGTNKPKKEWTEAELAQLLKSISTTPSAAPCEVISPTAARWKDV